MTVHNLLLCAHTLWMNYVTNTFLLVSSSVRSKQLLSFVHGQGQKREQKHTTKKFLRFHNHSPRLTILVQKPAIVVPSAVFLLVHGFRLKRTVLGAGQALLYLLEFNFIFSPGL